MKNIIEGIVKALVDDSDAVSIVETRGQKVNIIEINVSGADISKVIGKEGRIANSIRNIAKAIAGKNKEKVIVEIIDNSK